MMILDYSQLSSRFEQPNVERNLTLNISCYSRSGKQ